jgi:hypothetical protein
VGAVVLLATLSAATQNETRRVMRDMGFNLLVLPSEADLDAFWADRTIRGDMPQDYVHDLAASGVQADHFIATLQKPMSWRGQSVLITGVLPDVGNLSLRPKKPMGYAIEPGAVFVGHTVAHRQGLREYDTIELGGRSFVVRRCLAQAGSRDDIRIWMHLADAQKLLEMPARINTIEALGCVCYGMTVDDLRAQVAAALPEVYVIEKTAIAHARTAQRRLMERYGALLVAVVLVAVMVWVALLGILNARSRRHELAIVRVVGYGSGWIALLIVARALIVGVAAAVVGLACAAAVNYAVAPTLFPVTGRAVGLDPTLAVVALVAVPLAAALGGVAAALAALSDDPALVLSKESA